LKREEVSVVEFMEERNREIGPALCQMILLEEFIE